MLGFGFDARTSGTVRKSSVETFDGGCTFVPEAEDIVGVEDVDISGVKE